MAEFSRTSRARLEGVDYRLVAWAHRMVREHHDCTVVYGLRTLGEQKRLVAQGLSRTLNSKHLKGLAVDLAPYPIDWENTKRFYWFAGMGLAVAQDMGLPIRWGGDWDGDRDLDDQTFMDLVHWELAV